MGGMPGMDGMGGGDSDDEEEEEEKAPGDKVPNADLGDLDAPEESTGKEE